MSVNWTLINGPNGFPNPANFVNCTLEICPIITSYYNYRLNLAANAFFLAFFALSLPVYIAIWIYTRRGLWFTLFMVIGLIAETVGYVGRLISYQNQWSWNGFLTQIVCLTIGPAFFSAAIYLCLGRIVILYGRKNSRIPPKWYLRIFMPCDCVSMILQGAGAGVAAVELQDNESINPGDDVLIAGLVFQVFTLFVFICLGVDFGIRVCWQSKRVGEAAAMTQDSRLVAVRNWWPFRGFLVALGLATITVFWRCVFRVAELDEGWVGPVTFKQGLFIGFEGVMMVVTVTALAIFHPSLCMGEAFGDMENEVPEGQSEARDSGGILVDGNPTATTSEDTTVEQRAQNKLEDHPTATTSEDTTVEQRAQNSLDDQIESTISEK